MTNPNTKRFLVWRSYHKLKAELDRIPLGSEISSDILAASGVAMTRTHVDTICSRLSTCKLNSISDTKGYVGYDYARSVPDVLAQMHK